MRLEKHGVILRKWDEAQLQGPGQGEESTRRSGMKVTMDSSRAASPHRSSAKKRY